MSTRKKAETFSKIICNKNSADTIGLFMFLLKITVYVERHKNDHQNPCLRPKLNLTSSTWHLDILTVRLFICK